MERIHDEAGDLGAEEVQTDGLTPSFLLLHLPPRCFRGLRSCVIGRSFIINHCDISRCVFNFRESPSFGLSE